MLDDNSEKHRRPMFLLQILSSLVTVVCVAILIFLIVYVQQQNQLQKEENMKKTMLVEKMNITIQKLEQQQNQLHIGFENDIKKLQNDTDFETNRIGNQIQIMNKNVSESLSKLNSVFSNSPESCYVGVKNGQIPNSAMSASSILSTAYAAYYGRLDRFVGIEYGFWHPAPDDYNAAWLQVDLGKPKRIVGVITQGRPFGADQWVTRYKISYANSTTSLINIRRNGQDVVFSGNSDRNSHVKNYFPIPVVARIFRLQAVARYGVPCVRIEYLFC